MEHEWWLALLAKASIADARRSEAAIRLARALQAFGSHIGIDWASLPLNEEVIIRIDLVDQITAEVETLISRCDELATRMDNAGAELEAAIRPEK